MEKRLTAEEVIANANIQNGVEHHYMQIDTGDVDTGAGWVDTLKNCDPEFDGAFDPDGDGAHLVEVVKDEDGDWVEA